jgi:cardiolipin synthase A/B
MNGDKVALLDHICAMAEALSPDTVESLSVRVRQIKVLDADGVLGGSNVRERALIQRMVDLWREVPDLPAICLSFGLLAASRTASQVADLQTIELAWTGPRTGVVPARRIDQALYELVSGSESHLLVISYAVFNVPKLVEAMNGAVARGVDIVLVLEFEGAEGEQAYDPLVALTGLHESIRVYHWPFPKRPLIAPGRRGFIHVKAAVADRNVALISSANLTSYGLDANMELGVLVRGAAVPQRITQHFEQLIRERVLEPWTGRPEAT